MSSMASCVDEFGKIASSKKEAPYQQTRSGRRPIRVETLLKKAAPAAGQEGVRSLGRGLWNVLAKHKKPLSLLGAGAVAGKGAEEYLVEPMELGLKMKSQGYGG